MDCKSISVFSPDFSNMILVDARRRARQEAGPGVVVADEAADLQAVHDFYLSEATIQMQGFSFGDVGLPDEFSNGYPDGIAPSLPFGPEFPTTDDGGGGSPDDMMRFFDIPVADQDGSIDGIATPSAPTSPGAGGGGFWGWVVQAAPRVTSDEDIPTKGDFSNFVLTRRGRYFCAVKGCTWHERGWKREDRGVVHVKKEHFRLLNFCCKEW
jgi:hypothetical protein